MDTKITNLYLFCEKWCPFIAWPWTNRGHLRFFTQNVMSKIFSDNTTMSGIPENLMIYTKTRICVYYIENDINLLLNLEQMAAILDFLPTMQYLIYLPTTPQYPAFLKRHKNTNMPLLYWKMIPVYSLTLNKWRPSWIFYPEHNVENIFWQYHYVRHTWKPQDRHKKTRKCLYYVENEINLLFDLGQMAAIIGFLPTMQRLK